MNFSINTKNKIFIWNNQGYGDSLTMIPIVEQLIEKYSDVQITMGLFEHHSYLFRHLPVKIIEIDYFKVFRSVNFDVWMPEDHKSICMWICKYYKSNEYSYHWKTVVEIANLEFKKRNLHYRIDEGDKWAEINLPKIQTNIPKNSIYIENGPACSGQNNFNIIVSNIAAKFPQFNFICSAKPDIDLSNIDYDDKRSMIDHQNIIRNENCLGFLGKGSGIFHLTHLYELEKKPKALFGYDLENFKIPWDSNYKCEFYDGNHQEMINFINKYFT
jgi:hypothetical protein